MEHNQLFTEFNVGAARQISLSAKVRMLAEYNIKERRRLKSDEMKVLKERNTTLENEKNDLDMKVTDLTASVAVRECEVADLDALVTSVKSQNDNLVDRVHELEVSSFGLREKVTVYEDCMALHLEETFYPYLLTTIFGRRWLLTYDMELAITKMPKLSWISFCLWSGNWIRENIKNHRSALRDVFVPLAEPFSAAALKGTKGTSDVMTVVATTTALSTILVSTSTVNPISIDDYEVIEADNQAIVDGNVASFANVDDADLHIPQ
ncbi:hypothetical protein Tco_0650359 [Tanacetum coccineum]